MIEGENGLPPAGWYPDPRDPSARRWWDGAAWTSHVAALQPVASAGAEPALTRRQLREQAGPLTQGAADDGLSAVAVLERPAEISSVEYARRAGGYEPRAPEPIAYPLNPSVVVYGSAHTLPVWLIATSPAWYAGLTAIVGGVFQALSPSGQPAIVGFPLLGGFITMLVLLSRADAARLADRGYIPPSPKWGWLPFVYLILRIQRTGAKSVGPLVTYLIAQIVYFGLIVAAVLVILAQVMGGQLPQPVSAGGVPGPDTGAADPYVAILTPDERAYFLTQEGIEAGVSGMLDSVLRVDELHCAEFTELQPGSTSQCLAFSEGARWVVSLELAPDDANFPFEIVDVQQLDDVAVES